MEADVARLNMSVTKLIELESKALNQHLLEFDPKALQAKVDRLTTALQETQMKTETDLRQSRMASAKVKDMDFRVQEQTQHFQDLQSKVRERMRDMHRQLSDLSKASVLA